MAAPGTAGTQGGTQGTEGTEEGTEGGTLGTEGTQGTEGTEEGTEEVTQGTEGTEEGTLGTEGTEEGTLGTEEGTLRTEEGTLGTEGTLGPLGTALPPPVSPFVPPLDCSGDDAHAMGREPLRILRQILAACALPELLESPALPKLARDRARSILKEMNAGNIGGYNHEHRSRAVPATVSRFLEFRDGGVPCDPRNILLCSGTATAVPFLLSLLRSPLPALPPGVLVPVPGPPRCAAAAALAGAVPVPYALDPARGWAPLEAALLRALRGARGRCQPRVLWVINPGDPTGHVLSRALQQRLLLLAAEAPLLLLADEEHQELSFSPRLPFLSFRRVLAELGVPAAAGVQLVSMHSLRSGAAAEGGFRAGFLEFLNVDPAVLRPLPLAQSLPPPGVPGRILLQLLLEPPDPRDPLSAQLEKHRRDLRRDLAANARRLQRGLGRAPGIRCQIPAGGPRAFPRVQIPEKARRRARALGLEPDAFFCRELREATGVEVTPGSHFGMDGDSGHLGLSLLLPAPALERALLLLSRFHARFLREFS